MRLVLILLSMMMVYSSAFAKMNVFVSILPQKYFVEKIAGDLVNTSVMVSPGASPATYEPKPKQMAQLSKSDIYFSIGVPFEKVWLKKFTSLNKDMLLVRTDSNINKRHIEKHEHHEDEHGHHDDDHADKKKGIKDPHIWLSPKLVKIQASNIANALIKMDRANAKAYEKGLKQFLSEINDTDKKIKKIVTEHTSFMVFHPSWGYFADDYHLEQIPVEREGKSPKPAQLKHFIKKVKELNLTAIFVQPQFSKREAGVIAKETGAKVVVVNPLAENWSDNLIKVAKILSK